MSTTAEHIAARSDSDLIARFVAKAEMLGIPAPATFINENLVTLIRSEAADGKTIVDVHAYAARAREQYITATPPPAGQDPAAVLDAYLEAAIAAASAGQEAT